MTSTTTHPAHASGTFRIGKTKVHRLGFGAMRLTGPGIWGEPADRAECVRVVPDRSPLNAVVLAIY